jgi:hypothetical protein
MADEEEFAEDETEEFPEDELEDELEEADPDLEDLDVEVLDDDDDEDMVEPDDVEAALDTILKDRLVAVEEEGEEEDDEVEVDDRGDPVDRILPKRPGEFVCQSCFLVKHPSQLADATRMYCRDCV